MGQQTSSGPLRYLRYGPQVPQGRLQHAGPTMSKRLSGSAKAPSVTSGAGRRWAWVDGAETGGHPLSVASLDEIVVPDRRGLARALFATHRRVAVRNGPEFCTCGDVWPCRSEE